MKNEKCGICRKRNQEEEQPLWHKAFAGYEKELLETGVSQPDFVYVVGDAYVDHPSFGAAIISRLLESQGYSVAMLPQPDWRSTKDIMRFGKPKLAFLVTGGNIDSMVAHYTAAKRKRSQDSYSPGGKAGLRQTVP